MAAVTDQPAQVISGSGGVLGDHLLRSRSMHSMTVLVDAPHPAAQDAADSTVS